MNEPSCRRPELSYPCPWEYKVIGLGEAALREAVNAIFQGRECEIRLSKTSSGGKYTSLAVTLTVRDEADRLALFQALRDHPHVVFVL